MGMSSDNSTAKNTRMRALFKSPFFLLGTVIIFQVVLAVLQAGDLVDDAYISARYARNFVNGHGLVYNLGVEQRVEGYSNFMWTLLLALGMKLGAGPEIFSQILGILFNLLSLLVLAGWMRLETGEDGPAFWAALILGTNLGLAIWAVEGLETAMFAFFVLAAFRYYEDGSGLRPRGIFFAFLASLTRPEGLIVFAGFFISRVVILAKTRYRPVLTDALNFMGFTLPYLVFLAWRKSYYTESILPNSYYAKSGLGWHGIIEGFRYLWGFIHHEGFAFFLLLFFGILGYVRRPSRRFLAAGMFLLLYLCFILWFGGDFMPHHRFFVHLIPLLYAVLLVGLIRLSGWRRDHNAFVLTRPLVAIIAVLVFGMNMYRVVDYEINEGNEKSWHRNQSEFYMPAAKWVLQHVWQSDTVAAGDIGYLGYFSGVDRIVDTMGLVDRHIAGLEGNASFKTDLDYVFSREPYCILTMVHVYPVPSQRVERMLEPWIELGHSEFDRELASDERLKKDYVFRKEFFAWHDVEVSRTDMQRRESDVYIRIYTRNPL